MVRHHHRCAWVQLLMWTLADIHLRQNWSIHLLPHRAYFTLSDLNINCHSSTINDTSNMITMKDIQLAIIAISSPNNSLNVYSTILVVWTVNIFFLAVSNLEPSINTSILPLFYSQFILQILIRVVCKMIPRYQDAINRLSVVYVKLT